MSLRSDPRQTYRKKKNYWVTPKTVGICFALISVGLLFSYSSNRRTPSSSPLSRVMLPVSAVLQSGRNLVTDTLTGLVDNFRAKKALTSMQEELEKLQKENTELRYRLREHESYVQAMNLPRDEAYPALAAIVMARDDRLTASFIVNRGSADGLSVNMPVWNEQGLVGRVEKLSPNAARILLITDPGSSVGVYVEGTSYEGIVRGSEDKRNLVLRDLYLQSGEEENILPQAGQAVYTSGRGMVFPRNLLAGYVTGATAEGGGLEVKPAVDVQSVRAVLIMNRTPLQEETLSLLTEDE